MALEIGLRFISKHRYRMAEVSFPGIGCSGRSHPLPTDHFIEPNAYEFYFLGLLEGRPRAEEDDEGGMIGGVGHQVSAQPEEHE